MSRLSLILLVLLTGFLGTKNVQGQEIQGWIGLGQQAMDRGDVYGAIHYLGQAYALDSTDLDLKYQYASALYAAKEYSRALDIYVEVYNKGRGRFYPKTAGHIAQLLMYEGRYESSIEFWRRAMRKAEDGQIPMMEQRMKSCAYALTHSEESDSVLVQNAGSMINSTESDFGAAMVDDRLLFASMRGEVDEQLALMDTTDYRIRLYSATRESGDWRALDTMDIPLSEGMFHALNPSFSPDGQWLYFTECPEQGECRIVRKEISSEQLEILPDAVNRPGTSNTMPHPCRIGERDALLFVSDRPGGKGGMDIYLWFEGEEEADQLGACNSRGDDISPSYDAEEDVIYFSSDWFEGYGGQDIFKLEWGGGVSGKKPINLGLPLNSSVNDMYFSWFGNEGYLTSNREGSMSIKGTHCCNDLYRVERPFIEEAVMSVDSVIDVSIPDSITSVDELRDRLPIALYFHNDIPNPGSRSTTTAVNYSSTVDDYLAMEAQYVQSQDVSDSLAQPAMMEFFKEEVAGEFDRLEKVTQLILNELKKGKDIRIAIKGYASPLAKSDYNKRLTKRRIASVVNYLSNTLDGAMAPYLSMDHPVRLIIEPIPYGEDRASNQVSDQLEDRDRSVYSLGAAMERRVEILRIQEEP